MEDAKKRARAIRDMVEKYPDEVLEALLERAFWPNGLETGRFYFRQSDDGDGMGNGIGIAVAGVGSRIGDVMVDVRSEVHEDAPWFTHCFRTELGGGRSRRLRNAFLFLAKAIVLDEEAFPDPPRDRQ